MNSYQSRIKYDIVGRILPHIPKYRGIFIDAIDFRFIIEDLIKDKGEKYYATTSNG
jgi:hypothetical protein